MGTIFDISPDIIAATQAGIADLITYFGKDCTLVYPPQNTPCGNCFSSVSTGRSMNIYRTGGPVPFMQGNLCPFCGGKGLRQVEQTEVLHMLCQWNPKNYMKLAGNIAVPYSTVLTKGYMADAPKILRARRMLVELPIAPYGRYMFNLDSEPVDQNNIVQGVFFVAVWKRAG